MKLAKAIKEYVEGDMHVPGEKVPLQELAAFLKVIDRPAAITELRGYGFEIEDE